MKYDKNLPPSRFRIRKSIRIIARIPLLHALEYSKNAFCCPHHKGEDMMQYPSTTIKIHAAAFYFVYTSRDLHEIANVFGVTEYAVRKWAKTPQWEKHLTFSATPATEIFSPNRHATPSAMLAKPLKKPEKSTSKPCETVNPRTNLRPSLAKPSAYRGGVSTRGRNSTAGAI